MDLSKLSNEDLIALRNGDLSKVSNEGLMALRSSAEPERPGFGSPRDIISGVNRSIAGIGDALVAGYNLMLPKSQEVQPLSEGMRSVGIDLDRPRSFLGMLGEYSMPGPGGWQRQAAQTALATTGGFLARQAAPDSLLAEIGGSIAAPMSILTAQQATRLALRGKDAAPMVERLARADAIGAPMTVGTATQKPVLQTLERLSGSVPGGVNSFREAGKKAAEAIKAKLDKLIGGPADDAVKAGRVIQRGLFDPDTGWTAKAREVGNKLYARLDEKLSVDDWFASRGDPNPYPSTVSGWPDARWPASQLSDTAPIMNAPPSVPGQMIDRVNRQGRIERRAGIPGALGVSREVTDPFPLEVNRLDTPPGVQPPKAGAARGFAALNTQQFVSTANKGVPGAPKLSEQLFQDKEVQALFDGLADDLMGGNGRVPYDAIKQLRTHVGDLLGDPELIGSARRDLLNKFYKSLSDDMRDAAKKAGALKEFERANAYHKAKIERIEDFYDALYKKTTPEEVWNAVIGDSPKSASRISAIRKGLTPEQWGYLRKTVITRMGKPVASAAKEGDLDFAAGTFLTNYQRMKSNGSLTAIFGSGQYRKDLDQVATYASELRGSAEILSNPSGTAGLGLAASIYYGALGMVGMLAGGGAATGLVGIGTGLVANATVARLMNNQRFVHWLARSTKVPQADMANHLKRLPIIVGNDPQDLADVQEFISAVTGEDPAP
jgi:hypothetical protein